MENSKNNINKISILNILEDFPILIREWNYKKNININNISKGSHKKVWWICDNEHEWESEIRSRVNGHGCPYCNHLLPTKEYNLGNNIILSKEWDYEKNNNKPEDVCPFSIKKKWWKCKNGHSWESTIANRSSGYGCPYCSGRLPSIENNLGSIKKLTDEWNYEKNLLLPKDYSLGSCKKVWWKCKKGHEWQCIVSNRRKGSGCPYCAGDKASKENCLSTVNPVLVKQWNYEKNDNLTPENVTWGSNKEVWWKCEKGHEWQANIKRRNKGIGCPYCSGRYATKENNLNNNKVLIEEWNFDKNNEDPKQVAPYSHKKVWWKCKNGHEWIASVINRNKGSSGCPKCARYKIRLKDGFICDSLIEAYYYLKLKSKNIVFEYNKKYKDINKRYDFYVPMYNTYIEITGFSKKTKNYNDSSFWLKYFNNILYKKRYVEEILKAKFRFIHLTINEKQKQYVNGFRL